LIPSRLTPAAYDDIAQAAQYYEGKREGLGGQFIDRVLEAIDQIEQNPVGYAVRFEGLRRANLRHFPYALWFQLRQDNSLLIACLSGRRDLRLVRERALGIIPFPKGPEPS